MNDHIENISNVYEKKYLQRAKKDFQEAADFMSWLDDNSSGIDWGLPSISWKNPVYRITYGGYNPTTVSGSLAKGGRFNIGGSQLCHLMPYFKMTASLYAASTLNCALEEVGVPLGNGKPYILTPKKTFLMWDLLDLIHSKILFPGIKKSIDDSPMAAKWEYQKIPKISQIIANLLRSIGGDGIVYPSIKDPKGLNISFFLKDDKDSKSLFKVDECKLGSVFKR